MEWTPEKSMETHKGLEKIVSKGILSALTEYTDETKQEETVVTPDSTGKKQVDKTIQLQTCQIILHPIPMWGGG